MLLYLRSVWQCRYFWMSLVRMDLRTRYRRSVLGIGWSLLHPVSMTFILCAVFSGIFNQPWQQYAPYLLIGLSAWGYLSSCITQGCQAFFHNESYIRQCSLPLAIYPLRVVLGATFHFLIALAMSVLFVGILHLFDPVAVPWKASAIVFGLAPAVALLFVFAWSLALIAALANVFFQDTQHLAEVGLSILFYLTPIFYKPEMLQGRGLGFVVEWNPVAVLLGLIRSAVLGGELPPVIDFATAAGFVATFATVAVVMLARMQKRLIFHL